MVGKYSPIASLLTDTEVMDEIRSKVGAGEKSLPMAKRLGIPTETIASLIETKDPSPEKFATRPFSEAIIVELGRPVLLVQNDTFEIPTSGEWGSRLRPYKSKIDQAFRSVGRMEVEGHPTFDWIGTAWMISEDVAVTNRHVALEFARLHREKSFVFRRGLDGGSMQAYIDFREEYAQRAEELEFKVSDILFIEDDVEDAPDLALVRLRTDRTLPSPIPLSSKEVKPHLHCGVIGYPARDSRNDSEVALKVFGDIYNVKRFAPGWVIDTVEEYTGVFAHDCTTLGGNSGSIVLDLVTGEAIGLHFAGQYKYANFAVKSTVLLEALRRLEIKIPFSPARVDVPETLETEERNSADYEDREGYREDFLGDEDRYRVPLPTVTSDLGEQVATLKDDDEESELKYTNFSIVMNKERRMAFFTAVNVDGKQTRRIPRDDNWFFDPRISEIFQVGDELYKRNDLDRGHLVRRLDPVWGNDAEVANEDTFHFTNATPQHKDFNQKTWNDLENYILDNAGAFDLKISVFTGPVFREDDKVYRSVKIPQQYWKIVVMVNDRRKLLATGYMISQSDLIENLERVFTFGAFRTYQVEIAKIEELTGLDFGDLRNFDPMREEARRERAEGIHEGREINRRGERVSPDNGFFRVLERLEDIVLN